MFLFFWNTRLLLLTHKCIIVYYLFHQFVINYFNRINLLLNLFLCVINLCRTLNFYSFTLSLILHRSKLCLLIRKEWNVNHEMKKWEPIILNKNMRANLCEGNFSQKFSFLSFVVYFSFIFSCFVSLYFVDFILWMLNFIIRKKSFRNKMCVS